METSFSLHTEQDKSEIGLFGTKGGVKLCPELHLYTDMAGYMTNTTVATHTALNFDGLFEREIQHFVSCAAGEETACRAPAADGVTLMRILDAIYVSAQSGHEVVLD